MAGKKVLVTAGPTREAIDPVRYITNHSTGKMGYAIAQAAARRGAEVTLVSGPVNLKAPLGVKLVPVTSAGEMFQAVTEASSMQDVIVKAAAVADYRPKYVGTEKTKKKDGDMNLEMERTDDILAWLGAHRQPGQVLCGFSHGDRKYAGKFSGKAEEKECRHDCCQQFKDSGSRLWNGYECCDHHYQRRSRGAGYDDKGTGGTSAFEPYYGQTLQRE